MPTPGTLLDLGAIAKGASPVLSGAVDPSTEIPGMAPNMGQFMLPHQITFSGVIGSMTKVYRPSDEAVKDALANAALIRNDLTVMECVEGRQRAVALLNWHLEPEDEKDPQQLEVCHHLTKIIERIPRFMQYRENLLHATFFGKYAIGHRWRRAWIGDRMRWAVDWWKPIHGDKVVFRYDPDSYLWQDDQPGIRVGVGWNAQQTIANRWTVEKASQVEQTSEGMAYFPKPWERPLLSIHKHYIEDGEYEIPRNAGRIHGVGIRSRIYWTWYQKQETLAWLMEYLERSAGGFEIWYYPQGNATAKEEVYKAARDRLSFGRNVILVPKQQGGDQFGPSYDRIEPSMAGAEALKAIVVEYFGHQIKRYILGQTLTTEASNTGLGSNTAEIHLATFFSIVKYDAINLEETISTDLVEPLKKFNFPWARFQVRFKIDTESDDAAAKMDAFQKAYNMGLKIKAQDVMDLIGASKPQHGDEVLSIADKQQPGGGGMPPGMGGPPQGPQGAPPQGQPPQMDPSGMQPHDQQQQPQGDDASGDTAGADPDGSEDVANVEHYAKGGAGQMNLFDNSGGKSPPAKQTQLKWVTVGGTEEGGKKHAGGTHVQIDTKSGDIVAGPKALADKGITNLHDFGKTDKERAAKAKDEPEEKPEPPKDAPTVEEPEEPQAEAKAEEAKHESLQHDPEHPEAHIHEAVGKRFGIPPATVRAVLETDPQEMKDRDKYLSPSNTAEPTTDFPKFPLGTPRIDAYRDADNAYVDYLRTFDPKELKTSEHEGGIKGTQTYQDYVQWAKDGHQPPPISVFDSDRNDGTLVSTNRRRVLAAQDAGSESIVGWHGKLNTETGLPLKYGDIKKAAEEARQATGGKTAEEQPVENAPEEPKPETDEDVYNRMEAVRGHEDFREYGKALDALTPEQRRTYLDRSTKERTAKARSERGKKAAETRKRREEQHAKFVSTEHGKRLHESSSKIEELGRRYTSGGTVHDHEWREAETEVENASLANKLEEAVANPHVSDKSRNENAPALSATEGPEATSATRDGGIPWRVRHLEGKPYETISGASIGYSTVNPDQRVVTLYGTRKGTMENDPGGSRGTLIIHFDAGDPAQSKRARKLISAIANGKAMDADLYDLRDFITDGKMPGTAPKAPAEQEPKPEPPVNANAESPEPQANTVDVDAGGEAPEPQAAPTPASKKPWQMTYKELRESLNPGNREELERARPLLASMYPADDATISATEADDPWGIHRAIHKGDSIPRVPLHDLSQRHKKSIREAIAAGHDVPQSVKDDYDEFKSPAKESVSTPEESVSTPEESVSASQESPEPEAATERPFTYGDVYRDKDGNLVTMHGGGGLGSGRVRTVPVGKPKESRQWESRSNLTPHMRSEDWHANPDNPRLIANHGEMPDEKEEVSESVPQATKSQGEATQKPKQTKTDAAKTSGEEPEKPATNHEDTSGPLTLDMLSDRQDAIRNGTTTAAQVRDWYEHAKARTDDIKGELKKKTIAELKKMGAGGWHANSMNKGDLVNDMHRKILEQHHVGKSLSYGFGKGEYEKALDTAIGKQTDEHLKAHADEVAQARAERSEKIAKIKAAIENPQTKEDFDLFKQYKGLDKLTPEQQARYDEVHSITRRETEAAKKATVQQVAPPSGSGLAINVQEGFHAKKGTKLWVATLNQRVERDKYEQLNTAAKKLGGYYSSFRGNGAIPGFQFNSPEAAEKFKQVLSGNVDTSEERAARQETREKTAAETIRERADSLHEAAQDTLNADRKTNTARRAGQAAGIESRARADQAKAKTMHAIADGLEKGTLTHLKGIRHGTHVDALDSALRNGKRANWEAAQKAGDRTSYEDAMAAPHTEADVAATQYPYPSMWSDDLRRHAQELSDVPGMKNLAKSLKKTAAGESPFKTQGKGYKFSGGRLLGHDALESVGIKGLKPDKMVRVHQSYDWRLAQQGKGGGPFYTADGGNTWGTTPEIAVSAAAHKTGQLDTVDAPQERRITFRNSEAIADLTAAAHSLRKHPNPQLRRIGERLHDQLEGYNRMQSADIKGPEELRAALREYLPIKSNREAEDPIKKAERALVGRKFEGFFPTPRPLVDRMLDAADIQPGHSVLEPSAGKGDILDAVHERHPEAETHAVEVQPALRDILKLKGHNVVGHDFNEHEGQQYDRVIMNPPFENGQDREHVQRAYEQLKPGGRLVAIMSSGPFFRGHKADQDFREWLDQHGGEVEDNPEGSFAGSDAFRQTGVNTKMVILNKPE